MRSERWAVMLLLSAGSNRLRYSVCWDTLTCFGLQIGMHTDKSSTHLITHFYRHIIVETYTLTPTKTAPNISDYVDHTHSECVQEIVHAGTSTHTFAYANKMYHETLDFRNAKCAWRTAMNYWLNLASVLVYGNIHWWQMLLNDSQASLCSLHVLPMSARVPFESSGFLQQSKDMRVGLSSNVSWDGQEFIQMSSQKSSALFSSQPILNWAMMTFKH